MISTPVIKLEICARFLPFGGPLVAVLPYHDDDTIMDCPDLAYLLLFSSRDYRATTT